MLKFIICEDEKVLAMKYRNEIDKFMMKFDDDYECYIFDGYGKAWQNFAREDNGDFKIYILDIKTNEGSGIDAARIIREELDDWTSMIIMVTSFNEYKYDALSKRLMLIDFINKLDNCEKHLQEALTIAMKNYEKRPKVLRYTYKGEIYNIEFKYITYIEKEQDEKRCKVHTTLGREETYPGTITKLMTILDKRFMKVSRNTIINLEQVKGYISKSNKIVFRNNESTDSIARDKKKGIINYVRGIRWCNMFYNNGTYRNLCSAENFK